MAGIKIADRTMAALQKSLDLRAQKQQVIAANIANAETPGYAARKLTFEDDLRKAIASPETPMRT
ncbi:MAG: flagellar basal body rod protein FlgB, partial [Desulfuromonadales bacterium]|nr:flagellar basal body rod protein FlgB [Desulfuromonadales bacterium]